MGDLLKGISSFRGAVFPNHSALYASWREKASNHKP